MSWKFDRTRLITPALMVGFVLIWHFYVTWFNVSKFIVPPPLEVWDALVELLTTPSTLPSHLGDALRNAPGLPDREHDRRCAWHRAGQNAVARARS